MAPLHLYIHIPFCMHKCPYCDFNSHVRPDIDWEKYRQALIDEMHHWAHQGQFAGRRLDTIYIGGGTPSLTPPECLARLLEHAESLFGFGEDVEISMEANPGAVDVSHFTDYRTAGINRLSIGVQSFDDRELQWLERIHDARDAVNALQAAREAGFGNINLDLMYGLPGQSLAAWDASLRKAVSLEPEHLSCYQLTIEEHTRLAARHADTPLDLPDDEMALKFFHNTRRQLGTAGYAAYEISNFARPERQCRHNDAYWLYHDYIGIGAGACGKWDAPDGGVRRYANMRSPEGYMKADMQHGGAINIDEALPSGKAAAEAIWLGLRRREGISRPWFTERFGQDAWEMFGHALASWQEAGCLKLEAERMRLSAKGTNLADAIAAGLFAAENRQHAT